MADNSTIFNEPGLPITHRQPHTHHHHSLMQGEIAQRFPPSTAGFWLNQWLIVCSFPASTVGMQTVASLNAAMHSHKGAWEREMNREIKHSVI